MIVVRKKQLCRSSRECLSPDHAGIGQIPFLSKFHDFSKSIIRKFWKGGFVPLIRVRRDTFKNANPPFPPRRLGGKKKAPLFVRNFCALALSSPCGLDAARGLFTVTITCCAPCNTIVKFGLFLDSKFMTESYLKYFNFQLKTIC